MFLTSSETNTGNSPERRCIRSRLSSLLFLAGAIMGTLSLLTPPALHLPFFLLFFLTGLFWIIAALLGIFASGAAPARETLAEDPRLRPEVWAVALAMGLLTLSAQLANHVLTAQRQRNFRILVATISGPEAGKIPVANSLINHLWRETTDQRNTRIIQVRAVMDGKHQHVTAGKLLRKYHGDIICWGTYSPTPGGTRIILHVRHRSESRRIPGGNFSLRSPLHSLRCPLPTAFTLLSDWKTGTRDLGLFLSGYSRLIQGHPRVAAITLTAALRFSSGMPNGMALLFRGNAWLRAGELTRAESDSAAAVTLDPSLAEGWNQRAICALRMDRPDAAQGFLANAAAMDPSWHIPHFNRGSLLAAAGGSDPAREALKSALARSPRDVDSLFNLGILELETHHFSLTEDIMTRIIQSHPRMADARYFRGICRFRRREFELATEDFSLTVRLQPSWTQALHDLGAAYARRGRLFMAVHSFTRALARDPGNTHTRWLRGLAYYLSGEFPKAEADCTRLLRKNPENASALTLRGRARFRLGDPYAAAKDFSRLSFLSVTDPNPLVLRGNAYLEADSPEAAEKDFSRALALDPEKPEAWVGRSLARWMMNRRSEAITDLNHALQIHSGNAQIWLLSGILHRQFEEFDTAIQHIRTSIRLKPSDLEPRFQLALTLFLAGETAPSAREFNRVIARNPDHHEALNFRGILRQVSGNLAGALQDFIHTITLVPEEPAYWMSLANTRLIMGDEKGAAGDFRRASRLLPHDPLPVFFTGQALEEGGNHREALALYRDTLGKVQGDTLPLYRALMRRILELEKDLTRMHPQERESAGENP